MLGCAATAALAALAVDLVGPGRRVDTWLWDCVAQLVAPTVADTDTLVFGLDDASISALQPLLGPWPYQRDVWAHVLRYLDTAGATHITLDVLLTDPRPGDEQLRDVLAGLDTVALAAVAVPFQIGADRETVSQTRALRIDADAPARTSSDLVEPRPDFASRAILGVATAVPDEDGAVRRLAVLTRVGTSFYPGLAFTSLLGEDRVVGARRTWRGPILTLGGHAIPVDEDGQVELRFPRRLPSLPTLPFADLVRAAVTPQAGGDLASTVQGKRVFIGATALLLEEPVRTPIGSTSGVEFLRLVSGLVEEGAVVRPRRWAFDGVLLIAIMAVFLAVRARNSHRTRTLVLGMVSAWVATVAIALVLLVWAQQRVALYVPMAAASMAAIMLGLADLARLRRERTRLEADALAAERASELKTQFLNHVAHELRTPVTAILGFGRLIIEGRTPSATEEYARVISRNGAHLLHLVNNLLDDATLSVGRARVAPQPIAVRLLVSDVLATMEGLPRQDGVALSGEVAAGVPPYLLIDALRVRQVLLNLLANAMKFTDVGSIHLSVDWDSRAMIVRVTDTGSGMAPSVLARVFDEFELGDPRAIRAGGTGLGLSVSRRLARLMGGDLCAESTEGRGSCFTFTLPTRVVDAPPGVEGGSEPFPDAIDEAGPLVLICDDVEDIQQLFAVVLASAGARVETVDNGADAVTETLRLWPDAVVMDLDLPGQDGIVTVQALRREGYDGPVIAVSGSGNDREASLRQHGFTDSARKPVSSALLIDLVSRHVRGWQPRSSGQRPTA